MGERIDVAKKIYGKTNSWKRAEEYRINKARQQQLKKKKKNSDTSATSAFLVFFELRTLIQSIDHSQSNAFNTFYLIFCGRIRVRTVERSLSDHRTYFLQ
jgi:hypothetical protein